MKKYDKIFYEKENAMDVEICHNLDEVRQHIDAIDRQIVALLAERGAYVKQAAKYKKTLSDVKAPDRVAQVITKVHSISLEVGADPKIVEKIYRTMINAFIEAELLEFSELTSKD